jgi:hypothetical protein
MFFTGSTPRQAGGPALKRLPFGIRSIHVVRRLRAMMENLIEILPPERVLLLRSELELLQRSAGRSFLEPEDQAQAKVSDLRGVPGKSSAAMVPA